MVLHYTESYFIELMVVYGKVWYSIVIHSSLGFVMILCYTRVLYATEYYSMVLYGNTWYYMVLYFYDEC